MRSANRRSLALRTALALSILTATAAAAIAQDLPRVRLVATGGTISNRTGGRLTAEELVRSIPDLARHVRAEWEQFSNVASSELTLAQYVALARRLNDLFAGDRALAGIVVTCGTDTLEELAYFLSLTVRDERPVVIVGAMRNPSTLGYEGAANLLEGFRTAAEPASRGKGALVVLNDEINAAREVTKTDALRLHTFQSRGYGVLGVVDRDRVVFFREPVKRRAARSEFDVAAIGGLPRVDVILVYQDAPGDLIRAAVDNGAKGIVVAGAGAGATSGTQQEGMSYAASKGVFVVITTRTGAGRIADFRGPAVAPTPGEGTAATGSPATRPPSAGQLPAGAEAARSGRRAGRGPVEFYIAGEDLAPVKARILLMLALAKTSKPAEIQRMFAEY